MAIPYRARLNERTLLNLPGFHGGAYVYVYVEDTSERDLFYPAGLRLRLRALPGELRAALGLRDRGLRGHDPARVRRRYGGRARKLAAQAGHALGGARRLPRCADPGVRAYDRRERELEAVRSE